MALQDIVPRCVVYTGLRKEMQCRIYCHGVVNGSVALLKLPAAFCGAARFKRIKSTLSCTSSAVHYSRRITFLPFLMVISIIFKLTDGARARVCVCSYCVCNANTRHGTLGRVGNVGYFSFACRCKTCVSLSSKSWAQPTYTSISLVAHT